MKKVRFIYNPSSGETLISEWLDHIVMIYQRHGYTLLPYRLGFCDEEEDMILTGVDNTFHHILIAGGDGTVNYVVNQMKQRSIDVPIAVLPTGTANDFALTLGMPTTLAKACKRILNGSVDRIDLGCANGEYFVNVFSCGLFTEVSQRTPTFLKNTFGKLAYYFGGLGELPKFRKMQISVKTEVGSYEGSSLIFFVFNGRTAGQMRVAYLSQPDDGLLDVIVVKGDSPVETMRTIFHFMQQNMPLHPTRESYTNGVVHFQCREVKIESYGGESTDMDGQAGPRFPIKITCEPGALQVIRPQKR